MVEVCLLLRTNTQLLHLRALYSYVTNGNIIKRSPELSMHTFKLILRKTFAKLKEICTIFFQFKNTPNTLLPVGRNCNVN